MQYLLHFAGRTKNEEEQFMEKSLLDFVARSFHKTRFSGETKTKIFWPIECKYGNWTRRFYRNSETTSCDLFDGLILQANFIRKKFTDRQQRQRCREKKKGALGAAGIIKASFSNFLRYYFFPFFIRKDLMKLDSC